MTNKISVEWLEEQDACIAGIIWFQKQSDTNSIVVLKKLIAEKRLDWANWTIVRVMNREQYLAYGIYAAEQVIDIFEKKFPNDMRPRAAIAATKSVLKNDTKESRAV